ncbi:transglycosylase SLT domain-containing protein [Pigmentibacter sp. JX0631]|uniref:lytic transglycosylase domain-containing protein n=1 Tax=Pigmentibacter sp. JX0631 TaxID=2976982 RepID=UPI0024694E54|nr:lytic transglycosylase domain-containing protein [Pigmentibacter sp. JX0631]WGL59394.1 transglycosylase SLT domain-containing protein [Pigmentibacter sp. JX0631]
MKFNNINILDKNEPSKKKKVFLTACKTLTTFCFLPLLVSCQSSLKQSDLYLSSENSEIYSKNSSIDKKLANNEKQESNQSTSRFDAKKESKKQGIVKSQKPQQAYAPPKKTKPEEDLELSSDNNIIPSPDETEDLNDNLSLTTSDEAISLEKLETSELAGFSQNYSTGEGAENTLICDDNIYYDSWKEQFDSQWLANHGHEHSSVAQRNKALALARTNEYIKIVYPSIEKTGFDFPVVINQQVLQWINYFTNPGRNYFVVWLKRGRALMPKMEKILEEYGLPKDLKYLSMIESGYNPKALSYVGAVGLWQFMPATARENGLIINDYLDERRDLNKSTRAAANYLSRLYSTFGSWHLSAASYNGGPGLVRKTLRNYGTDSSFFELTSMGVVNKETADYVPKLIAAMIIAKNQEKFGFDTTDAPLPAPTKIVEVKRSIALSDLAQNLKIDKSVLEAMNPELRLGITPPASATAEGKFDLEVPASHYENALLAINQLPEASNKYIIAARIHRRESLVSFAARYKVSQAAILHANSKLKANAHLRKGQVIYIPISLGNGMYDKLTAQKFLAKRNASKKSQIHHISSKNSKIVAQNEHISKSKKAKSSSMQKSKKKIKSLATAQQKSSKGKKVATSGNRKTSR